MSSSAEALWRLASHPLAPKCDRWAALRGWIWSLLACHGTGTGSDCCCLFQPFPMVSLMFFYVFFCIYYVYIYIYKIIQVYIYIYTFRTQTRRNLRVWKIPQFFRQNLRYFHPFWKHGLGTGYVRASYGFKINIRGVVFNWKPRFSYVFPKYLRFFCVDPRNS